METTNLASKTISETELRVLLYGFATAGKTTLAGTFPTPMLVFDFDNKLDPLFGKGGIEAITYPFDNPQSASQSWRKFMKDFKEAKKDSKWNTLVFDSLSQMDIDLLLHCLVLSGKHGAEDKPTLPVYGEMAENYKWFFSELNHIPGKHIIVNAHCMEVRDDEEGGSGSLLAMTPLITGKKITPRLPSMFKEVWFLERQEQKRVLHYTPYKKAIASSMLLKGNGVIEEPTYERIINEIKKGTKI
jgi:hypothetical protein